MQSNDYIILLLSKRFSGEITPDESAVLKEWLDQSAENERLAAQLQQIWESAGHYEKTFSPDLDAAFRQLQSRIRQTEKPGTKVVPLGRQLLRIAAALALLVAAVWAYREFSAPSAIIKSFVAAEDKRLIRLPDGSQVWLRRDAMVEFPEKFSGAERRINLMGEAYFEVAHDPARPFYVDLPNGDFVQVLGTQFGVRILADQSRTDVIVRSGKVLFAPKYQPNGVVLSARQKAISRRDETQLIVDKNVTLNELAWQTGGLEFISTPVNEVIADLEQYYNVKIALRNTALQYCLHTAPLTNQPIEKVLESLALTYQLRVTSPAPGQYVLSGGTCQ